MKKFIAILITVFLAFSGTEAFAMTFSEAKKLDLTEKSGYTAKELEKGLRGELSAYAEDLIAAERKYGVNAVFLAAVSALESGWGRHCFRENNIFGWSGKSFSSKSACIDFVASKIKQNYLSENGKYHRGKTVSAVNVCYNGNSFWEEKVLGIMVMISEKAGEPLFEKAENTGGVLVVTLG